MTGALARLTSPVAWPPLRATRRATWKSQPITTPDARFDATSFPAPSTVLTWNVPRSRLLLLFSLVIIAMTFMLGSTHVLVSRLLPHAATGRYFRRRYAAPAGGQIEGTTPWPRMVAGTINTSGEVGIVALH